VNKFESFLESKRKADKQHALEYGRIVDATYKEFSEPIEKAKLEIQKKLNDVAKEKEAKAQKERQELLRKQEITSNINKFVLDYSVKIAAATTNEQLLSIERLINLEKGNKNRYEEQEQLLIERCNELTGKIAEQKKLVKEREAIEKEKEEAKKSGDDAKVEELEFKGAELDSKIEDNTIYVQENAANSLIEVGNEELDSIESPKARRTTWKAEIQDINVAIKKSKDLLKIELEPEKVRTSIATLKGAGAFDGKEELIVNGIRYFQEKLY
jgi:hypothetical protein